MFSPSATRRTSTRQTDVPDRPPLLVRCKPMPDGREMFHRRQRIKWYYTSLSKVIVNNNGGRSFLRQ